MNNCPTHRLEGLIKGSQPLDRLAQMESHIESCERCQQKLEQLAADDQFWSKASSFLSDPVTESDGCSTQVNLNDSIVVQTAQPAAASDEAVAGNGHLTSSIENLLDAPSHPEMLGRVDQFQIEEEIGRGGCGIVFRGFDTRLNRPVAIKFLAPHLSASGVARKRFEREARAVAAVSHPNVVSIHNVNASDNRPYIVMSFIDGLSIEAAVKKSGFFDSKSIVQIAEQVASGLAAAHRQGLIHRDIKPANIILEKGFSKAIITDFGLARAADEMALTQTGWLAGTPHYMSPEQARGDTIDQRSDLFSLGSALYFLATGQPPFQGDKPFAVMQSIMNDRQAPACSVNPDLSPVLSKIIDKLLEKKPADRFQSATEVHGVLEKFLAHLNNPNSEHKAPRIVTSHHRKRIRFWALLACGIAALAAGFFFWPATSLQLPESQGSQQAVRESRIESLVDELKQYRDIKTFEQMNGELQDIDRQIREMESQLWN